MAGAITIILLLAAVVLVYCRLPGEPVEEQEREEREEDRIPDEPLDVVITESEDGISIVLADDASETQSKPASRSTEKIQTPTEKEKLLMELGMIDDCGNAVESKAEEGGHVLRIISQDIDLFGRRRKRCRISFDERFIMENPDLYEVIEAITR